MKAGLAAPLFLLPCLAAVPVWIDTDPSVARGGHEVDDGIALVQAFRSPELAVRGVSVVFGNTALKQALPIGRRIVRQFGPPSVRVYEGAASAAALGRETAATRAIAAALRKEPLTILVLGPATNVATVVMHHPELMVRITRVIAVAGRRPGQSFRASAEAKPFRDLNFELDPEAFRVLVAAKVPLVLAPWEISSKVWLETPDLAALRASDKRLAALADACDDWLAFWKEKLHAPGFNPFDALAVGYTIAPEQFHCERVELTIQTLPNDVPGAAASKPYLLRGEEVPSSSSIYCSDAPPGFKADLLRRLGGGADAR